MSTYFVIFGAAVRADGKPSGTLRRRVEGALSAAQGVTTARFMPTGGVAHTGHIEADVIAGLLLQAGMPADRIVCEREARDTLDSVYRCDRLLKLATDVEWVAICTSSYHLPRCFLLFRAMGWNVRWIHTPSEWGALPWWKLWLYVLKEIVALPYDLTLLTINRKLTSYQGRRHPRTPSKH